MLRLDDVHVHIGKLHILQGVNLKVKVVECAALLGRNGVGKTTTLRAIMGLAPRSRGTVEFGGFDLSRCEPHEVPRKGIGYIPQGRGSSPISPYWKTSASGFARGATRNARNTCLDAFHVSRNVSGSRGIRFPAASSRCSQSRAVS
jgi:ABC-type dipeptide/oligopeptide/nickel transport system ATPase subunit